MVGVSSLGLGVVAVALLVSNQDRIRMRHEESACNRGDIKTCLQLAENYASGTNVKANPQQAEKLVAQATQLLSIQCRSGSATSCFQLGEVELKKKGGDNQTRALAAFEGGCKKGLSKSCSRAAALTLGPARRAALLSKACELGDNRVCVDVSTKLLASGKIKQAIDLLESACEHEHGWACFEVSSIFLGQRGAAVDLKRSVALAAKGIKPLRRACESALSGANTEDPMHPCEMLAELLDQGRGAPRAIDQAYNLWTAACEAGSETSCATLRPKIEGSVDAYLAACDKGDIAACLTAGDLEKFGVGTERSAIRASRVYDKAVQLAREGCKTKDAAACKTLARMYARGLGIGMDPKAATKAFKRAESILAERCNSQTPSRHQACQDLATMLKEGIALPVNVEPPAAEERCCETWTSDSKHERCHPQPSSSHRRNHQ